VTPSRWLVMMMMFTLKNYLFQIRVLIRVDSNICIRISDKMVDVVDLDDHVAGADKQGLMVDPNVQVRVDLDIHGGMAGEYV